MVERHERRPVRLLAVLLVGLAATVLVFAALAVRDVRMGDRFDLVRWQIDAFPNRWITLAGGVLHGQPDPDETIRRYFSYKQGDPARIRLEPDLQLIVEGRLDAVLQELGIDGRISLPGSTFPPVNIQIAESPLVLVTSPRAVIERRSVSLLRPNLAPARALEIEAEAEESDVSAIVLPSGGLATYPAIVADRGTYQGLLQVAAHEWVHHYLAFYPLGIRYFTSADMQVVNETVADIVGDEVADLVLARWGDPTDPVDPTKDSPVSLDHFAVLRDLRVEVDILLAAGQIVEAEQRMNEVRDELAASGFVVRRINQAYFAWFGTYAARPDAVDPIGGYLRDIRERVGSLSAFIDLVREVDSRGEIEDQLSNLGGTLEGLRDGE